MPSSRQQQQQQHASATSAAKEKQRLCTNCKNHGLRKVWKKHKRYCKYRDCPCAKCMKTAATRKNCAEQTAKRRARQEDEQREQELQLNPANFLDERPIPYPGSTILQQQQASDTACTSSMSTFRSIRQLSVSSLVAASSTTRVSSEYDDSSSIDIDGADIDGGGGGGGGGGAERDVGGDDGKCNTVDIDIDADSKPGITSDQIEDVKTILKELIGRTKDFQSLNAFRLFVLQHNTYDVDKAAKLIKRAHEELKFLDLMSEKNNANAADEKSVLGTQPAGRAVGRLPISAAAVAGHHHHHLHHHHETEPLPQPHQLLHNRTGVATDYGGDTATASSSSPPPPPPPPPRPPPSPGIVSAGGPAAVRRPFFNGNVTGALCGVTGGAGGHHPPHMAVWHPRPLYPFPLALPNTANFWHHSQPPFPPPVNATFSPFIESEWSRHCRLPIFNPELSMEPVDLQQHNNGHHRNHREPNRALDIVQERLERSAAAHHNRLPAVQINLLQQDDREPARHHA